MTMPDVGLGSWFGLRASRSANRRALTFEGTTLRNELHDHEEALTS